MTGSAFRAVGYHGFTKKKEAPGQTSPKSLCHPCKGRTNYRTAWLCELPAYYAVRCVKSTIPRTRNAFNWDLAISIGSGGM